MKNYSSKTVLPKSELTYFRERTKSAVFELVLSHFALMASTEGLTKKELANKLGKDKAQISRWFSGPSNWTLDTVSDLLLAMESEMKGKVVPLMDNTSNQLEEDKIYFEQHDTSSGEADAINYVIKSSENDWPQYVTRL